MIKRSLSLWVISVAEEEESEFLVEEVDSSRTLRGGSYVRNGVQRTLLRTI